MITIRFHLLEYILYNHNYNYHDTFNDFHDWSTTFVFCWYYCVAKKQEAKNKNYLLEDFFLSLTI